MAEARVEEAVAMLLVGETGRETEQEEGGVMEIGLGMDSSRAREEDEDVRRVTQDGEGM